MERAHMAWTQLAGGLAQGLTSQTTLECWPRLRVCVTIAHNDFFFAQLSPSRRWAVARMDHTLLRRFVTAADELHFARAAKALNIPRSELLESIRMMEAELGYDLFDREAPTTVLTDAGAAFLVEARSRLDRSDAAARASAPAPGGKAKASKGKGRAPAVKGERKPGRRRQGR